MLKRVLYWGNGVITRFRESNSGDWAWLSTKPMPLVGLNRSLWRTAAPSSSYYALLSLSVVIAALGLLANSAATIIGAMIVAPLMGPILGIAFSMVMGNRRLLRRSGLSLITGVLLAVGIAALISQLLGLETVTPEISARIRPTLIDLGVALAAGAAGAFAKSRRDIADALPGVAIAVALVPPLSVVGIGLSLGSHPITWGATLLFLTNLIGIIFSGSLVFLFQRYGSIARAQRGLFIAIVALAILGIPLGVSFQDLIVREQTRAQISRLIRQQTLTFADRDIQRLSVQRQDSELLVELDVSAPQGTISNRQVTLVREFLEKTLQRSITLEVRVIPTETFTVPPD